MMLKKGGAVQLYVFVTSSIRPHCRLYTFTDTDLDTKLSTSLVVRPPGARVVCNDNPFNIKEAPVLSGYCCVEGELYLAGGQVSSGTSIGGDLRTFYSNLLMSMQADGSTPRTWRWNVLEPRMEQVRAFPILIPYEGKIMIFGGCRTLDSWIEIYDPERGNVIPKDLPEDFIELTKGPSSWFLWESTGTMDWADGTEPRKKTAVMANCLSRDKEAVGSRLFSYNLQDEQWETFDPCFPSCPRVFLDGYRNLIPNGNTLFIIDYGGVWSIYDLSSKKVVQEMLVEGLEKDKDRVVINAFCQPCPDSSESLIFTIFMDGNYDEAKVRYGIPFAKVRVFKEVGKSSFAARVKCEGCLDVGGYLIFSIVAREIDKTSAVESRPKVKKYKKKNKKNKKDVAKKKLLEALVSVHKLHQ